MRRVLAALLSVALVALAAVPEAQAALDLTVYDITGEYHPGEKVSVSGVVSEPNLDISLDVKNPAGALRVTEQVNADRNGKFSVTVIVPMNGEPGLWTVSVAASGVDRKVTFSVAALNTGGGASAGGGSTTGAVISTPTQLIVDPSGAITVQAGKTVPVSAKVLSAAGVELSGYAVTWRVVSGPGEVDSQSRYISTKAGTAVLEASAAGLKARSGSIVVEALEAIKVEISAPNPLIRTGETVRLAVEGKDRYGNSVEVNGTWSLVSGAGLAIVRPDGTLRARAEGRVAVGFKVGSLSATQFLEISGNQVLDQEGGKVVGAGITVEVPRDALKGELQLILEASTASLPPGAVSLIKAPIALKARGAGGTAVADPRMPLKVQLQVEGDAAGALVFYLDPKVKSWIALPTTADGTSVTADVPAFSSVTVLRHETVRVLSDMGKHWSLPEVLRLQSLGVVAGYPDGTYGPERYITRAELIKMLVVAAGKQPAAETLAISALPDSAEIPTWVQPYVATAVQAGLLKHLGDGAFSASTQVSRLEAAMFLEPLLNVEPAELPFKDVSGLTAAQKQALGKAVAAGIIKGYEDNTFRPEVILSRAQLAAVVSRVIWDRASQNSN